MKRTRIFCFITIIFCFCYSCTYEKAEPECYPPDVVSYSGNIQPIFDASCATVGCHSGAHPEGGLNLTAAVSYNQLMAHGTGYVDTINPDFSVLYAQMNSVSNPMPPAGKLDKCTIDLVLKWIRQKAKNN
ncbi:MAG: hypothetical protein JWP12_3870 [Bacteroidetes bacterium]|nr:hypothetical protein [Bacteroidota bacterium]